MAQSPCVRVHRVRDPGVDLPAHLILGHRRVSPAVAQPAQAVAEARHVLLRQPAPAAGQQHEAEKPRRLGRRHGPRLLWMQAQPSPLEVGRDAVSPVFEPARVVVEQREVVHVAQVSLRPKHLLAEMVEPVEIEVGEELAGQVAYRKPAAALDRRQEVVARKPQVHGFLRVGTVHDPVHKIQRAPARDAPAQVPLEYFVVDRREIAVDVAAQHMAEAVAERLVSAYGAVRAPALAVGIAVVDEAALEQGFAHRVQRLVHHPVAKRRGGDDPALRIVDRKLLVAPRQVGAIQELMFEAQYLRLQVREKGGGTGARPLSPHGAYGRRVQGIEARDALKEVVFLPWHCGFSARRRSCVRSRRARAPRAGTGAGRECAGRAPA